MKPIKWDTNRTLSVNDWMNLIMNKNLIVALKCGRELMCCRQKIINYYYYILWNAKLLVFVREMSKYVYCKGSGEKAKQWVPQNVSWICDEYQ